MSNFSAILILIIDNRLNAHILGFCILGERHCTTSQFLHTRVNFTGILLSSALVGIMIVLLLRSYVYVCLEIKKKYKK